MTAEIQTLLTELEAKRGIEILYVCESGSRAWGFESPDSDYDIRFLYRTPVTESYLVTSGTDTIEVPIENDSDPGGGDLRKSLRLLAKSNGALIEWMHSPIVYRKNDLFLRELRELAHENFCRKNLANHYRGMAHKVMGTGMKADSPTGNAYLYALRALLSAHHVLKEGSAPPVAFEGLLGLLPDEVRKQVDELLGARRSLQGDSRRLMSILPVLLKRCLGYQTACNQRWFPTSPSMRCYTGGRCGREAYLICKWQRRTLH